MHFSVTDNSGGFSGSVSYDSSKLEYVSSAFNGTGSYNGGTVALVGGESFSVTFRAKSAGSASVSLTNIMLGDGNRGSNSSTTVNIKSNNTTIRESGSEPDVEPEPDNDPEPDSQDNEPEPVTTNFSNVNDTVYATKSINVRSGPSTNYSKIGGLYANQAVTRTGVGENGWSRISYNGGTAYVLTALITTDSPSDEEEQPDEQETTPEENPEDVSPEENPEEQPEQVTEENPQTEKTEEEIYNEIVSKVGTIPEVGTNYNIYVFALIFVISVLSFGIIIKK